MSYAAQPPLAAPPQSMPGAPPAPRRPAAVTTAVALLWTMAVAGFVYAAGMVAVTPGTVGRFRDATSGSEVAENFIAVIWLDSAVGAVVALLVVALFVVLGLGLRRGSRVAWGVTLAACALGVLGGCGSVAAIGTQQSGDAVAGSLGEALNEAYPAGWIGLNAAVAVAQVIAYLMVGFLLLLAPRAFFRGGGAAAVHPQGGMPPAGFGYAMPPVYPPSESPVTTSPWAAPQSADQYSPSDQSPSDADQNVAHPAAQKPAPRPEDEFWSRPSE
ncbi:hypothetical protein AB0C07_13120 [Actinoplanes missouriensis]|uniref:hypothetical protein n=1 Tax=Actinoplanes missouriensis TaxID=1866 RepID=UPI00340EA594